MRITKAEVGKIAALGDRYVAILELEVTAPAPNQRHTTLVLDCSGSMTASIDDVREDSQKYIGSLDENTFASVIIFSGHGRAKLIAGPTQCNAKGREMVNRAIKQEVKILDTTVFSEPLELALATVKRLAGDDTAHNVVLFTDGCPVPTKWNVDIERSKAFKVANQLRDFGASVSVIGYGVYYDSEFITQLVAAAGNTGIFCHISEIDEFKDAIAAIHDVAAKTAPLPANLAFAPDKGTAGRVLRTAPEIASVSTNGKVQTTGIYDNRLHLMIELSGPAQTITVTGTIGGAKVQETITPKPLSNESVANFIRVLGALAFLSGDRDGAAELLKLTGDEGLADQAANAYTDREAREVGNIFRRAFVNRNFIGSGLKSTGPNHCVLNAMRELLEDDGNVIFMKAGAYKRGGELTRDPRVIESPHGKSLRAVNYQSNTKRWNFSLVCEKDVQVAPEDGKGPPVAKKVYRTYNVIRDGNLVVSELEARLSQTSFTKLQEAGVIGADEKYVATKTYALNFKGMKIVSTNWANPTTLQYAALLREEVELATEQTALNARIKELGGETSRAERDDVYVEKAMKVEDAVQEYYMAPHAEIRLLGYKSKTDYAAASAKLNLDDAASRVQTVRKRLKTVRFISRVIEFACHLTGWKTIKWDTGETTKRGKDEKLERNAVWSGLNLKLVTWTEQMVCS